MNRIDSIRARLAKATPGPWNLETLAAAPPDKARADADLIVNAPQDIADLLAVADAGRRLNLGCRTWPEKVALPADIKGCGDCPACQFNAALAALDGQETR